MTYYRRKPADASVLAGALAAGAAIGAATFYLVKLWLQREPLETSDEEVVEQAGDSEPETSEGTESSR